MRANSLNPSIPRPAPFRLACTQTPFLTSLKKAFHGDDVGQAVEVLTKATDADWADLGDWACQFPDMDVKVHFLLDACKCMPHHQDKAAETLLNIAEELREAPVDMAHGPAALEHMLHAATHARWVDILAARPDLLARYCALIGKGTDAARAYCMLAKHLASKEDTTPYAWEVWKRSVKGLDDATRRHITTHIRAVDRPVFNTKQHALYRRLAPQMSDQSSFKTRIPIYRFVFHGTLEEQMERRYIALRAFLHNAGRVLGRAARLEEFEGIRCLYTDDGRPAIEIYYSSHVAETMRYYMGFASNGDHWPSEINYQSMVNKVIVEFEHLWAGVKPASTLPTKSELSWGEDASRERYAMVMQHLSAHNLLIGESHGHLAALNFLIQNMRWLRETGYSVIYLENMPAEAQGLANEFLHGNKPLAIELQLIHAREFLTLLKAAKEVGMHVVFIDTELVGSLPERGLDIDPRRCAAFNAFACSVINENADCGGEKFVLLLGGFHIWSSGEAGERAGIWGVQHALPNCKSLFMFDVPAASGSVPGKPFFICSHDQKYKMQLTNEHSLFHIVADIYIGAQQPAQMSMDNDASTGLMQRGALAFEMPPEFSTT